ncbi:MAG: hypothetical protein ACOCZX_02080, partial [Candidatus Bipolaricaulota bacterium]
YLFAKTRDQVDLYLVSEVPDSRDLRKICTPLTMGQVDDLIQEASSIGVLKMGSSTLPQLRSA